MDRLSILIDKIFAGIEARRRAAGEIVADKTLDEREMIEFKRLSDQADLLMQIVITLHENEDQTIRGIWGGGA